MSAIGSESIRYRSGYEADGQHAAEEKTFGQNIDGNFDRMERIAEKLPC